MDVQTVNEVGITLAGILGVGLFYWIGKKNAERSRKRRPGTGAQEETSGKQEKE